MSERENESECEGESEREKERKRVNERSEELRDHTTRTHTYSLPPTQIHTPAYGRCVGPAPCTLSWRVWDSRLESETHSMRESVCEREIGGAERP